MKMLLYSLRLIFFNRKYILENWFFRGTGNIIPNKADSLQPHLQRQLWKKLKLHLGLCKNPQSSSSPRIGAIHKADHHFDEGIEVWKAPWATHQRTNALWRWWTNRLGEMAVGHHTAENRGFGALVDDPRLAGQQEPRRGCKPPEEVRQTTNPIS